MRNLLSETRNCVFKMLNFADELLLADASPKVYRGEWHAAVATVFKACCEIAPAPVCRPRGAIRYSLLSRGEVLERVRQHAHAAGGTGGSGGAPAAGVTDQGCDHIVSTHSVIKTLDVRRFMLCFVSVYAVFVLKQ